MPFRELQESLAEEIINYLGNASVNQRDLIRLFSSPPKLELGHIALPCFQLAKHAGKKSNEVAQDLSKHLNQKGLEAKPTGPYVNIKWNLHKVYSKTVQTIFDQGTHYGSDQIGNGKRIIIEYCSPNVAKKLAFQHIRSTLIGNVLANIHSKLGYQVERINFVGDWGTQFSRLLAAFELWGDKQKLSEENISSSMDHLFELYVRFHKELDQDPKLLELAADCLKRLENDEKAALEVWKSIRKISLSAMETTLQRMNVEFDHVEGESRYLPNIQSTLEQIKQSAKAELSEGAWVVHLENISTPALVQKTDGTTLYLTRDIAAALDRYKRFEFHKMYYVVSSQQKLHFEQLFGVLKKMGLSWYERCDHLSFGTVLFGAEKMSTREGNVVFLDDLLNEAKDLALKECTKKNPDLSEKEDVAEKVAISAIIFGELSSHKQRDIDFKWEHVLALDGETGPYAQYSLVRCYSLLEKAAERGEVIGELKPTDNLKISAEEEALILTLSKFRSTLHQCTEENEPFFLTRYLIDLAKVFNRFYYQLPVLQAENADQRTMRLNLVKATKQVFENGFSLLGVQCPREM